MSLDSSADNSAETIKIKIGCEIFIFKDGKLLLGKRKNCYGEGTWGLPGGHLNPGEEAHDGARRELEEELKISGGNLRFSMLTNDVFLTPNNHYLHISFTLDNFGGEFTHMEQDKCEEWRFFDVNDLPENIFPHHKNIIKGYFQNRNYWPPLEL
jgi:8-oxo-dGTP diphosphatase